MIVDIEEYEHTQATIRLMNELALGKKSGVEEGWISAGDVREYFNKKDNEK